MAFFKSGRLIERTLSVASAAGTTVLVNNTQQNIRVTGTTTQTIQLPDATTCPNGTIFSVADSSTDVVTVTYDDTTTLSLITPTTDKTFVLFDNSTSNGVWVVKAGSGSGSGTGGINYIENPDAETGTSGWLRYKDAAGTVPVDGTGGSPNITFDTSEVVRGSKSFTITKDAANRQGEGVSYQIESIDPVDRGQLLTLQFDYEVIGSGFATGDSSDVRIFVWDAGGGGQLLGTSNNSILANKGHFQCTVQMVNADDQMRVIFHIATTNASGWIFAFDNVQFGPHQITFGPAMSDFKTTPTIIEAVTTDPTKGTTTIDQMSYRRVGDSMEIILQYEQTAAGSAGSGTYLFKLPGDVSIDTSKYTLPTSAGSAALGSATAFDGTDLYTGLVYAYDSQHLVMVVLNDTTTAAGVSDSFLGLGGTTRFYGFQAVVPIDGWTTNTVTAESRTVRIADVIQFGTNVTVDPTQLGEYRTFTRDASTSSAYTDDAPGTAPSFDDGLKIYNRSNGSAPTTGNTERWDIFVGMSKHVTYEFYASVGRTGSLSTDVIITDGTTAMTGIHKTYDPSTGIVSVWAANANTGASAGATVGFAGPGSPQTSGYFDIIVSDNAIQVQQENNSMDVVFVKDVKTSGTNGGTFTSGSFQTRDLNTLVDPYGRGFCSVGTNQFTLVPGIYEIEVKAPAQQVNVHQAILYNITDSLEEISGSAAVTTSADSNMSYSFVEGVLIVSGLSKTYEVQHQCALTQATIGLGQSASYAANEVYTQVKIRKIG